MYSYCIFYFCPADILDLELLIACFQRKPKFKLHAWTLLITVCNVQCTTGVILCRNAFVVSAFY